MNTQMAQPQASGPSVAEMMLLEHRGTIDLFAKLTTSCYSKCIPNVHDPALNVGEMHCVDRCVSKYLDVHEMVGKEFQNGQRGARPAACRRGLTRRSLQERGV